MRELWENKLWVNAYYRVRNGKLEHVRGHWRRLPRSRKSNIIQFPTPHVA